GGSCGAARRLRGGGTSRSGTVRPGRSGAAVRPRAPPGACGLRGEGTVDCGAEGLSRSSYSPVVGLNTHWSAGSMFSARPRPCASTVACILRRGHAAPFPSQGARVSVSQCAPTGRPDGLDLKELTHRIAHTNRPKQSAATPVTNSTLLQAGNSPISLDKCAHSWSCLCVTFTCRRPRRRCCRRSEEHTSELQSRENLVC